MDFHKPATAEVADTVRRSHRAQGQLPAAVDRMVPLEVGDLVVEVAVGMRQWVAAEGKYWGAVRYTIPVSSWVADRHCTQAGSNRTLEGR